MTTKQNNDIFYKEKLNQLPIFLGLYEKESIISLEKDAPKEASFLSYNSDVSLTFSSPKPISKLLKYV